MDSPTQTPDIPTTVEKPRRRVWRPTHFDHLTFCRPFADMNSQSSSWMPAYEGLTRNRIEAAARRQSMSDQQAKLGIFGTFFHK
ncbi:hypothetical protein BM221_003105 [Beauveria bassiana]|uniref:Uncharacterized protein n=1 Tax=Beauveria bassiana TaxID=176275 RepID=A0A2N6NTQ4_BEABA|nr:hypothetical protein BM221_003105 [Beauveria bassiana]